MISQLKQEITRYEQVVTTLRSALSVLQQSITKSLSILAAVYLLLIVGGQLRLLYGEGA